ncbi:hypothetical protein FNV43_RR13820 [Rhamnella rubrinervis]|uniref:CASP-like protein n=1 Tax=Rhamnella rubrinervis TaxID=2594499 RepID=A0A8K0H1W7_9ROSA|nr:hypothetical protein FNV43_RR13820 [Rhamnella rubrinervis]
MKAIEFSKTRMTMVLRIIAAAAAITAAIVMLTNKDTVFRPTCYQIKYLNLQAYVYFVVANLIAGIYTLLVLLIPANSLLWRTIVAVDAVMCMLVSAANSAALTASLLEKKGNKYVGWNSICDSISSFCVQAFAAISVSLLGLFAFLVLLLFSIHNVLNPLLVEDD